MYCNHSVYLRVGLATPSPFVSLKERIGPALFFLCLLICSLFADRRYTQSHWSYILSITALYYYSLNDFYLFILFIYFYSVYGPDFSETGFIFHLLT